MTDFDEKSQLVNKEVPTAIQGNVQPYHSLGDGPPPRYVGYPGYAAQPANTQVIVTQPEIVLIREDPELRRLMEVNDMFLVFSCFVTCCCNLLFGCIGLGLGWAAQDMLSQGDKERGRCLSHASCVVSAVGIVVSIVVVVVFVVILLNTPA